jgi:cupin superfamily acireductone dioxygenase involved in methionine salvage
MSCDTQNGTKISGNIAFREVRPAFFDPERGFPEGHEHEFDHTTYCIRGGIRIQLVWPDGTKKWYDLRAGEWLLIPAHVRHAMAATEQETVAHCVFSHRDPQGDVVQEYTGWDKAYDPIMRDA